MYRGVSIVLGLIVLAGAAGFGSVWMNRADAPQMEVASTAAPEEASAGGEAAPDEAASGDGVAVPPATSTEGQADAVSAEENPNATVDATAAADEAAPEAAAEAAAETVADVEETATAPALDIVRIEPDGSAVIAGNAAPSTRLGLIFNGDLVAETESGPSGDFVLVPDLPLPAGDGTLRVAIIDETGAPRVVGEEEVAVVLPQGGSADGFLVSILRPGQPVEIVENQAPAAVAEVALADDPAPRPAEPVDPPAQAVVDDADAAPVDVPQLEIASRIEPRAAEPSSEGVETAAAPAASEDPPAAVQPVVIDAIELEGERIWIAGAGAPGAVVRLYQDNALLGETRVSDQGRYLFEGVLGDAEGEVIVRADVLAPGSADVVSRAQVPFAMPERAPRIDVAEAEAEAEQPTLASAAPADAAPDAPQDDGATETALVVQPSAGAVTAATPRGDERVSVLDTGRVIIRRGDNLWTLSRRVYGQGIRYTSIYDANRAQIDDPALIYPGQVFDLPTPDAAWGEVPGIDALDPEQVAPR